VSGGFRSRQFMAFLLTGGIAAAVNFGSRIVFSRWLEFSAALVLAYCCGMVTAFLLARAFVFRDSTQPTHRSAGLFVLVNLVAILQTMAVSLLMLHVILPWLDVTRFAAEIAHGVGVVVPVFSSYLGHKRWTFAR